ncbi:peptide ABC transporter substrate-binding protein [Pasteurella atlantica]|uniref:Peptide ABC transporter substrate-binding protein n=2 Tax=Pasteurellaceae TaxID=712 RepID=A0ACC6HMM3_9PAST|nr:peptide ABC transporter substrate-binding protein [Pasteurella atlantica]MDP8052022.1 peptide ABC transporter substrate-binding protein [Pasteurella atlantica]MDP8105537.1 peptide ABC transporter substrate-binding protein [Pasteurella atlantica]MDP8148937.1 peptide ABC transporter substrate-binding protein [Pasteurella atlantica]
MKYFIKKTSIHYLFKTTKYWGCLIVALLLVACDQSNFSTTKQNNRSMDTLTRVIYAKQFYVDPIFTTSAKDTAPLRDLLTGLMIFNKKGDVINGVAEDWQTEDGKTWIFHLKNEARWSNKAPVTAQDFVASWQRLASNQNNSPLADYLIYMGIKNAQAVTSGKKFATELGVMAINEKTLKIELNRTNFQLPLMLTHSALLPTYQGKSPLLDLSFISNGQYQIEHINGNKLTLKATDPTVKFQNVIYVLQNETKTVNDFDIIENPTQTNTQYAFKLPKLCTYFYEFNFADPTIQNKNIRKAIKGMISVNDTVSNFGIPNASILPSSMNIESQTQWQPIVVEQLLHNEGITSQNPIHLTLTYDKQGIHQDIASSIIRSLSRSDLFKVSPKTVEWQDLLKIREQKQFQMIRSGWCTDYADPAQFLIQFHSKSPENKISYKNEKVDQLLEQLEHTQQSKNERQVLIHQIIQLLEEDVVILPLFQYQRTISLNNSIKGIDKENASEVIYSKDLYRASKEK